MCQRENSGGAAQILGCLIGSVRVWGYGTNFGLNWKSGRFRVGMDFVMDEEPAGLEGIMVVFGILVAAIEFGLWAW